VKYLSGSLTKLCSLLSLILTLTLTRLLSTPRSVHAGVNPSMALQTSIPIVPPGATFHYLNEGAANIVYRISVPAGTPPPSILDDFQEGEPAPSDEEMQELLRLSMGPFDSK
jgi:hypothetical protein